jgi:hypothetical protein
MVMLAQGFPDVFDGCFTFLLFGVSILTATMIFLWNKPRRNN